MLPKQGIKSHFGMGTVRKPALKISPPKVQTCEGQVALILRRPQPHEAGGRTEKNGHLLPYRRFSQAF